ncbi:helix-turn-helix domain-containing protein [Goodfellowiella coeruleoviolacea]|uniref:DNA-binding transcriptional regulator, XRE-family HTH domain n=1 Tax=Goodfellowiella coeruleoviolacea TaxID=334858 RepID=A0AAE3GJB2_9PSEU|nr:helix-turn-helix transcriptional regulator [Goodfellowiella coeruleoviolacea]MCP2169277.1 DNA-binding transcriptional regulator, XRE-family HTH domain [Goodfellowiella coeruleoviolacea]
MGTGPERTRRKAKFGRLMTQFRTRVDPALTPEKLAKQLGVNRTTINRMEAGLTVPSRLLMNALLGFYNVSDEERAEAEQLWHDAKQPPATVSFEPAGGPPEFRSLYRAEWEASEVINLATQAIPGLLQTPDYVRALERAAGASALSDEPIDAEAAVRARQGRQQRLTGPDPITVRALIDQGVLRRLVGGAAVMSDQLNHLLRLSELPNVTLRVIPETAGAYGLMSGSVTMLHFSDPDDPAAVYLEYPGGGSWVEDRAAVNRFRRMLEGVEEVALSADETAELIRELLAELEEQ